MRDYHWKEYTTYSAYVAQEDHELQATNKGPQLKLQDDYKFIDHVETKMLEDKWSSDAIIMGLK